MKEKITLRVNGKEFSLMIEPWWTLVRVLREELQLNGTKVGCEEGDCGTCTVLIDGVAVRSCIYPAMKADGREITTIEGLIDENGVLHPVQQAFLDKFAVQCGYCTPGMIMMAKSILDENPNPTEQEIKEGLSGNLCRCTGYVKIIDAVLTASKQQSGDS